MIQSIRARTRDLDGVQQLGLMFGVGLIGILVLIGIFNPAQFFRSYLVAYVFWSGLALGCLALGMLYRLTGGAWGFVIVRFLDAGASTIPLLALLFLPIAFGMGALYVWAQPNTVANDVLLQHKSLYLNVPFFLMRALAYFLIWTALVYVVDRWSQQLDHKPDPEAARRLQTFSAIGIAVLGLTVSFAMIDWVMSLEPAWYSTIFGAMLTMEAILAAFGFATAVAALLARRKLFAEAVSPRVLNDLGSLLLAFVMLWAYLAFSQFLLMWSGNLTEEIPWYLRRLQGGWEWLALAIVLLQFALPFALLISRDLKRNATALAAVALLVFSIHFVDVVWLIAPAFDTVPLAQHWPDVIAALGLGGIWTAAFVWRLKQRPLLPLHSPRPDQVRGMAHEHGS